MKKIFLWLTTWRAPVGLVAAHLKKPSVLSSKEKLQWHSSEKNEMKNIFHLTSGCEDIEINIQRVHQPRNLFLHVSREISRDCIISYAQASFPQNVFSLILKKSDSLVLPQHSSALLTHSQRSFTIKCCFELRWKQTTVKKELHYPTQCTKNSVFMTFSSEVMSMTQMPIEWRLCWWWMLNKCYTNRLANCAIWNFSLVTHRTVSIEQR